VKHILVTTDLSELADAALEPAASMARGAGAELTVFHTIATEAPPKPDPKGAYYKVALGLWETDQGVVADARRQLDERVARFADVSAQGALGRGDPVAAVLAHIAAHGVDLVVISSHGRTGLKRMLLGSVAEEVARRSPVPVLIWKTPA